MRPARETLHRQEQRERRAGLERKLLTPSSGGARHVGGRRHVRRHGAVGHAAVAAAVGERADHLEPGNGLRNTRTRLIVTVEPLVLAIRNAVTLSGVPTSPHTTRSAHARAVAAATRAARNVSASTTAAIGITNAAASCSEPHPRLRRRARAAHPPQRRDSRRSRHEVTRTQPMWEAPGRAPGSRTSSAALGPAERRSARSRRRVAAGCVAGRRRSGRWPLAASALESYRRGPRMALAACATSAISRPARLAVAPGFRQASSRLRSCPLQSEHPDAGAAAPVRRVCASRCRWRLLALVAGGCGASLGGRYDSATTAPGSRAHAGATAGSAARGDRAAAAGARSGLRERRASRARSRTRSARRSCATRMPRACRAPCIVPGLARDLPIISRGSRTFRVQLLAGLHFADGRRADDRGRSRDVRAPARPGDGLAGRGAVPGHRRARKTFAAGEDAAPARRARQRRPGHVHAQALRSGVPGAAGDADRVSGRERHASQGGPGLLARESTGRYRVVGAHSALIDLERVRGATAVPTGGTPGAAAHISITRLADAAALEAAIRSGDADSRSTTCRARRRPRSRCRRARSPSCASIRRSWPLSDENVRRALSLALDRRALALSDGGDVVRRALAPDRPAGAERAAAPIRASARALLRARRRGGHAAARSVGGAGGAGARRALDRGQLAAVGVHVDVRVARADAAAAPVRAHGSNGFDPAYGDPAAIFMPLADALAAGLAGAPREARARRRAAGRRCAPRRVPSSRRAPRRRRAWARFRCCVQTFPRRSRPCWWEEAPIRCSTSTSPCSPHAHDCTPTPAPAPAAV